MALPVAMVKGGHFSLSIVLSVWGQRGLIPSSQTHCGQCCMHVVPCGNSALGSMCVWGGGVHLCISEDARPIVICLFNAVELGLLCRLWYG